MSNEEEEEKEEKREDQKKARERKGNYIAKQESWLWKKRLLVVCLWTSSSHTTDNFQLTDRTTD